MKTRILATLMLVLVLVLVSVVPAFADSGTPVPIPPRTTTPVPPPDLQQKLQSTVKGGGYVPDVKLEYVSIKADPLVVRVGETVNLQVSFYPLDPRLTPATITIVTNEYWQSTILYGPTANVSVTWMNPGIKTVTVLIQANGGSMQANTIQVLVKPAPLVISMADYWTTCVKTYPCEIEIVTNRPVLTDDLAQGPIEVALFFWWLNHEPTFTLVSITGERNYYRFEYPNGYPGNTGLWVDLWTTNGYGGSTYVSMIEPSPVSPTSTPSIIIIPGKK